jgi:hypothetical protein
LKQTETVIVSIKLDHRDDSVSLSFPKSVMEIIDQNPNMWCRQDWSKTGSPKLGDCRGKAILFARFDWDNDQKPFGLHLGSDFSGHDNTKLASFNYGKGTVSIEDWYDVDTSSPYTAPVVNDKYEVVVNSVRQGYSRKDYNPNDVRIQFSSGYQNQCMFVLCGPCLN